MRKLEEGHAPNSVKLMYATMRAMLSAAVDDGVISTNPALKLGKSLSLVVSPKARSEQIKALDADQLATFLTVAERVTPACAPLFRTLAFTGLRPR